MWFGRVSKRAESHKYDVSTLMPRMHPSTETAHTSDMMITKL